MISEILLRRKNKLTISDAVPSSHPQNGLIAAIIKNVESLGYTFDAQVIYTLGTYSRAELIRFHDALIPMLRRLVGADKQYKPMYPNFPQQVAEAENAELFLNAILHYWSMGEWQPNYTAKIRLPLLDDNKMTVLTTGTDRDVLEIMTNLLSSKTSLSTQDRLDVYEIIKDYPEYYKYLPDTIPLKENVAYLGKTILDVAAVKDAAYISKYFATATDVLRFAAALSDGDISLSENTRFMHFNRPTRRMIMDLLAGCNHNTMLEDMNRYREQWLRLGEIIHPAAMPRVKKWLPVMQIFDRLREGESDISFMGKVQAYISTYMMLEAAKRLKQRPGEFARMLDKLLRDADDDDRDNILRMFRSVADKVSVPVLLQVREHFLHRNDDTPVRIVFPKGKAANAYAIPKIPKTISKKVCGTVACICELGIKAQFNSKPVMGRVYIAPELRNIIVPFSQRSASGGKTKTLTRGSRMPLSKDAKVVRGFIWWTNNDSLVRVDLDLSACVYDENFNYVSHISYTRLRDNNLGCYHSGDITNGGDINGSGVAEFIDLDIDRIVHRGRYVVFQVYSYTGEYFSSLTNARFGYMERQEVDSGEIFEPKTVKVNMDLNVGGTVTMPVIFDCVKREFIWCDMGVRIPQTTFGGNNLESNLRGAAAACYGVVNMNKPNLHDLIRLNAEARGIITKHRNEADIIFDNDTTPPTEIKMIPDETGKCKPVRVENADVPIITAYDTDYIMGQLL